MTYGLFVGINKYTVPGAGELNGCIKDCDTLRKAIFTIGQTSVVDESATKSNIIKYLREYAETLTSGDTFYLVWSGHGTYYDTPQGRVTIRVCYDDYLYDYELAKAFEQFRPGVTIISICDTCYAESNARFVVTPPIGSVKRFAKYTGRADIFPTSQKWEWKADVHLISSCTAMQVSYENANGGFFSQRLAKELSKSGRNRLTTLVKRIAKAIPFQTANYEKYGKKVPMI